MPDIAHTPQPAAAPPIQTDPIPETLPVYPIRRSTRVSRRPAHLTNYKCYSLNSPYPISVIVSYDKLSPSYRDFVFQVSSTIEPSFYY